MWYLQLSGIMIQTSSKEEEERKRKKKKIKEKKEKSRQVGKKQGPLSISFPLLQSVIAKAGISA